MNTSTTIVAELRRQRAAGNAVWPCITDLLKLIDNALGQRP